MDPMTIGRLGSVCARACAITGVWIDVDIENVVEEGSILMGGVHAEVSNCIWAKIVAPCRSRSRANVLQKNASKSGLRTPFVARQGSGWIKILPRIYHVPVQ